MARFDARPQRPQDRLVVLAFQQADALVDQLDQIGHAVGHRRVGGQRVDAAAQEGAAGAGCGRGVLASGMRSRSMSISSGTGSRPRNRHLGELLQPHQPERQVERVGIDHDACIREARRRIRCADRGSARAVSDRASIALRIKQRHRRRLADAGGADDREMACRAYRGWRCAPRCFRPGTACRWSIECRSARS